MCGRGARDAVANYGDALAPRRSLAVGSVLDHVDIDDRAQSEMERVSKAQPALLAYVMASSEELGEAAQELALYMFVVIHKAFEKQFGAKLQNAGMKQVEEQHDFNEQVLASLIGHEEEDLRSRRLGQPSGR